MTCRTRRTVRIGGLAVAFLGAAFACRAAHAQRFRPVPDGPINEAFVPAVTGVSALEAIGKPPPPPIIEKPPPTCDPQAIWIKGYWAYDEDSDDFEWVGGCWRRPPRGHFWIDGFWHQFDEGWVWIRGFWSPVPANNLVYIEDAPPDPPDDDAPPAGPGYFWLAGYWAYQPQTGYVQYAGRWVEMDPNFVLVPASYTWRPEGYVFIPAYWDWPLEDRGCTYQTVYIEPAARVPEFVYEPVVIVEPTVIVGWCYSYYPNYVYFVHHHYHHHHDWWYDHYDVPTWWGWHGWWSLSWHDHWGVWWWWSNPGYPHPHFMTAAYAARIAPPVHKTVFKVKNVYAPKIVTKYGVVAPKETLKDAVKDKSKGKEGKVTPVVAAKTKDKLLDDKKDPKDSGHKKRDADEGGIAKADILVPTGTKSAKDDDDDHKNKPPKPTKKRPHLVTVPGDATSPLTGKAKDDDKAKGKSGGPPITVKSRNVDGDSKSKGKSDDKPDKSTGKSGPAIVPSGSMKDKDKDKDKDKGKTKGKGDTKSAKDGEGSLQSPLVPASGGDKPKAKDKEDDAGPGKKSGGGTGAGSQGSGTSKAKDKAKDKPPPVPPGGDKDVGSDKEKKKEKNKKN